LITVEMTSAEVLGCSVTVV